jgi:hypothetical protein
MAVPAAVPGPYLLPQLVTQQQKVINDQQMQMNGMAQAIVTSDQVRATSEPGAGKGKQPGLAALLLKKQLFVGWQAPTPAMVATCCYCCADCPLTLRQRHPGPLYYSE